MQPCVNRDSHPLKVWDAEEDLHHRAQVARVAQVFDARVTRTKHCLQLHARLLDHLPFVEPRPGVVVCVVSVLRLWGGGLVWNCHWNTFGVFVGRRGDSPSSASVACLYRSVTSGPICGGPTQPPPPQTSRHLEQIPCSPQCRSAFLNSNGYSSAAIF